MTSAHLAVIARTTLGLVMLAAGVAKYATGLANFETALRDYRLLPAVAIRPLTLILPGAEIAVGSLLLGGLWLQGAATTSAALLLSFAAGIVVNLLRGRRDISCGCFGSREHKIGWSLVVRNVGLAAIALYVAGAIDPPGLTRSNPPEVAWTEALPATLIVAGAGLVWLVWMSLRDMSRSGRGDVGTLAPTSPVSQEAEPI